MSIDYTIDRPVTGDITESNRTDVDQIDGAEFLRRIDAVLALPGVAGVIWEQYTPYFNDGEPCEFSVNEPRIVFEDDVPDGSTIREAYENRDEEDHRFFEDGYLDYGFGYSVSDLWERKPGKNYNEVWTGGNRWGAGAKLNPDAVTFIGKDGTDLEPYYYALRDLGSAEWETVALKNFGDHATVIATREGFDVESYEHE
ncbi:hypothetical protein QEH42_gp057 [Microbacterium phage Pumpernickel]|uniref:Uncharacterized protein n=1 Tax=Microbacterium phage Pumpernickel TaxID=2885983 RepID=A0AAE8Y7F7_9CAUD|nr:hypothetical protein QEH42_gp057 [Microbacterium phage Pumpernickel]UDL15848.1 hypothetical protein SEA_PUMPERNICKEL_57 [Microbacterium phage Pumpernickel]